MIKNTTAITICCALIGCTAVTQQASQVMLYNASQSELLEKCERLGPVTGSGSGWKPRLNYDSWSGVAEDAKNDLRANTKTQYGGDAVVLIGLDKQLTSVVAQGIAYKCF